MIEVTPFSNKYDVYCVYLKKNTTGSVSRKPVFNTGKVQIGLRYEAPNHAQMTRDEERIQAALLRLDDRNWTAADLALYFVAAAAVAAIFVWGR
jgi:hypothetical protein